MHYRTFKLIIDMKKSKISISDQHQRTVYKKRGGSSPILGYEAHKYNNYNAVGIVGLNSGHILALMGAVRTRNLRKTQVRVG